MTAGLFLALVLCGCSSPAHRAVDRLKAQTSDNDLEELRKTDPSLVTFDESLRIKTGLARPRALAVGPGGVYVAGDRKVVQYGFDGKTKGSQALPEDARCLAVDANGKVFAGSDERVTVVDGANVRSWASHGAKAVFTSIAVGPDSVWVADAGNRHVVRYRLDGTQAAILCERDVAKKYPGLVVPSPHLDVALDSDGNLWVTNPGSHRVEKHTPEGAMLGAWGETSMEMKGFSGCCNPTDLALLGDTLVTAEKGLLRIKRYDLAGKFLDVVAGAETFNETIEALDLAAYEGKVYVLDPFDKVVRVYASKSGGKP